MGDLGRLRRSRPTMDLVDTLGTHGRLGHARGMRLGRRRIVRGIGASAAVFGCAPSSSTASALSGTGSPPANASSPNATAAGGDAPNADPSDHARSTAPNIAAGSHVLVVGGTGMLRAVSIELARRGHVTSVIARGHADLARMAEDTTGMISPLPLDYRDHDALVANLRGAIERHGPIALVVAWIHGTAPDAPITVARIAAQSGPLRYIHVLGSASDDPSRDGASERARFEAIAGVTYQEVILGFHREAGTSRWLTDDEIAAGVLAAIDEPSPRRIVGTTRPWSARP